MKISILFCFQFVFSTVAMTQSDWIIQLDEHFYPSTILSSLNLNHLRSNRFEITSIGKSFNTYRLQSSKSISLHDLTSIRGIQFAEPNNKLEIRTTPNDPLYSSQWYLERIKASKSWDLGSGDTTLNGDDIVVGVIEFGFLTTHEDLVNKIWVNPQEIPFNELDDDQNGYTDDINGLSIKNQNGIHPIDRLEFGLRPHGTSVAGLIAAETNNLKGTAGCSPGTKLVLGSFNSGIESEIIELFSYMYDLRKRFNETNGKEGAFIVAINFSGGIKFEKAVDHPIWCHLYEKMGEVGILNCGATANENINVELDGDMPSTCESNYLVMVTATQEVNDLKRTDAAYGLRSIDLGSPGENLLSPHSGSNQNYQALGNTSGATPLVSAAIALLYSYPCTAWSNLIKSSPSKAACMAKQAIMESVDKVPDLNSKTVSGGRLNIYEAVRWLKSNICEGNLETRNHSITNLIIGPNPATNYINIYTDFDCSGYLLNVFDVYGRTVYSNKNIATFQHIELPMLPDGIYFVSLGNNGNLLTKKIIIQK